MLWYLSQTVLHMRVAFHTVRFGKVRSRTQNISVLIAERTVTVQQPVQQYAKLPYRAWFRSVSTIRDPFRWRMLALSDGCARLGIIAFQNGCCSGNYQDGTTGAEL